MRETMLEQKKKKKKKKKEEEEQMITTNSNIPSLFTLYQTSLHMKV